MKMPKNVQPPMSLPLHIYLYKLCITLCVAGILSLFLFACGNGGQKTSNDSMTSTEMDTAMMSTDTTPGAQLPPGASNPGEDSARYGTGTGDSSKEKSH
jgi:hypothetical protein